MARALFGLLPRGLIWTSDASSRLQQHLAGMSVELSRIHGRATDLMDEADPQTTDEQLEDWERVCGLPKGTTALAATKAERRLDIVAHLSAQGGQSPAYYVALGLALGLTSCTVEEWPYGVPFRCNVARMGDRLGNSYDLFYWRVHAPAATAAALRTRLEWSIEHYKPAHTSVDFAYDL